MSEPGFLASAPLQLEASRPAPAGPHRFQLDIQFTGSGSEYLGIWIVNLLLTLVTLGVYYPWAKVRRLRYFYGNTRVGRHPLGFHANPRRMLRGYALVVLLLALYSAAGRVSQTAGLIAFVLIASLWPALLQASMRFRLANTSWRGLRFRFHGTMSGAYRALLPFFVPGALIVGALVGVPDRDQPPPWYGLLTLAALGLLGLLLPWLWWGLKKYQHDHFAYGPEQTQLRSGPRSFYAVFAKTAGVGVITLLAVFVVPSAMLFFGAASLRSGDAQRTQVLTAVLSVTLFALTALAIQLVPRPYFTSRMQNLLWSRTAGTAVRFKSTLAFWPLLRLTLKNWFLIALTLGLYWPFAAVATMRMRVEAVRIVMWVDPHILADIARAAESDAAGDAAGDLFGLDIGF
jgi:uncharacterized membrane protein YjgN (DUF898 family)